MRCALLVALLFSPAGLGFLPRADLRMPRISVVKLADNDPEAGLTAAEDLADVMSVLDLFAEMGFSSTTGKAMLRKCPNLLARSVPQLRQTAEFLALLWGSENLTLHAVEANPYLLCVDVEDGTQQSQEYLAGLGVSQAALRRIKRTKPQYLHLPVNATLRPRVEYLRDALPPGALPRIIGRFPEVLGLSVDSNLKPTLEFLQAVGAERIQRLLTNHPQILGYSLEKKIKPMISYWRSIGVVRVGRVIELAPSILGMSLSQNLEPKVAYFHSLGMNASRMLESHPNCFTLSLTQNIQPTVGYLMHEAKLPKAALEIQNYPAVLDVSVEFNLKPTVEYLTSLGYASADLRARYLGASLTGRIVPRQRFLEQEGVTERPTLATLTCSSDAKFCTSFGLDLVRYRYFRDELSPQLKFAGQFQRWVRDGTAIT